jgi:lysophospholipase L1-like esterase
MFSILCYGDSNTWGADPAVLGRRFPPHQRWPGALAAALGPDYHIIPEGMSGRTTTLDDPLEPGANGRDYLLPCLKSHKPLDLLMILLGTNDLKHKFNLGPFEVAQGAAQLARLALHSDTGPEGRPPAVLLICPPPLAPLNAFFGPLFAGGVEKSAQLAPFYQQMAAEVGAHFFDAGRVIQSSPQEGVHWEAEAQVALGQALADWVRAL